MRAILIGVLVLGLSGVSGAWDVPGWRVPAYRARPPRPWSGRRVPRQPLGGVRQHGLGLPGPVRVPRGAPRGVYGLRGGIPVDQYGVPVLDEVVPFAMAPGWEAN
jgi:hypothetical protein